MCNQLIWLMCYNYSWINFREIVKALEMYAIFHYCDHFWDGEQKRMHLPQTHIDTSILDCALNRAETDACFHSNRLFSCILAEMRCVKYICLIWMSATLSSVLLTSKCCSCSWSIIRFQCWSHHLSCIENKNRRDNANNHIVQSHKVAIHVPHI